MGFDFDISWDSQMVAEIDATTTGVGARVPVSVRNLRFSPVLTLALTLTLSLTLTLTLTLILTLTLTRCATCASTA